jgi:hypothetical protein
VSRRRRRQTARERLDVPITPAGRSETLGLLLGIEAQRRRRNCVQKERFKIRYFRREN